MAYYGRHEPGVERTTLDNGVRALRLHRDEAISGALERLRDGGAVLPRDARLLGGHHARGLAWTKSAEDPSSACLDMSTKQ